MAHKVKVVKFATGERFVHLIDSVTMLPHFESTAYNLMMLRGRNQATASIEQALRAIKIFLLFCDMRGISLSTRMQNGFLFQSGELDELLRLCRKPIADIELMLLASYLRAGSSSPKRLKLFPKAKSAAEVSSAWIVNRIVYIRDYIHWLANTKCGRLTPQHEHYRTLTEQRDSVHKKLTGALPMSKGRNVVNKRIGLDEEQQAALWRVIDPAYPKNVWTGLHCRVRNELMIRMFIKLGIRRGELAGTSVRDIDFRARTIFISRRADDKADPRESQPNTKTRDRTLPLSYDFIQRIQRYIFTERKAQEKASSHPFLFVANAGRPLGLRAINRVFEVLVERCDEFDELFPHLLRHTFNDNLSVSMDAKKISEPEEEKIRSEMNGWNPASGTAATYTKRTVQRRAKKAFLELQDNQPIKPIND
jgi:integrase